MKQLHYIAVLLIGIICLHFLANTFGLYDAQIAAGFVWFDNLLHALTGVVFGLLGLFLFDLTKRKASTSLKVISLLFFVLLTALVWELMELAFYELFTNYALSLKIYSPSVQEATADVASNVVGASLVVTKMLFIKSKK